MNMRITVLPFVDGDAAIERLNAIAHTVEASFRVLSGDGDLEGQRAIRVPHADRCLGPA